MYSLNTIISHRVKAL